MTYSGSERRLLTRGGSLPCVLEPRRRQDLSECTLCMALCSAWPARSRRSDRRRLRRSARQLARMPRSALMCGDSG
jgi:hypothetical protein